MNNKIKQKFKKIRRNKLIKKNKNNNNLKKLVMMIKIIYKIFNKNIIKAKTNIVKL